MTQKGSTETIKTLNELIESNDILIQQLTATNTLVMKAIHQNTKACISLISELGKPEVRQAKEYMNYAEAADYLGIPKGTLYQKVNKKLIPYSKIAGTVRFSRTDLDTWISGGRVLTSSEIGDVTNSIIRKK